MQAMQAMQEMHEMLQRSVHVLLVFLYLFMIIKTANWGILGISFEKSKERGDETLGLNARMEDLL
jgi:hypothetical protein